MHMFRFEKKHSINPNQLLELKKMMTGLRKSIVQQK